MANAQDDFVNGTAEIARNWRLPYKETRFCLILYKSPWVKRQKKREKKLAQQLAEKQQQGES